MNITNYWSRLPGFFALDIARRREILASLPIPIADADFSSLDEGLNRSVVDAMSENVFGAFQLPLACAVNFVIDGEAAVIPMAIEEPSIVAACSKMAKLAAENGGFATRVAPPITKGQIQFFDVNDTDKALADFQRLRPELLAIAQSFCLGMHARGGGVVGIEARVVPSSIGPLFLVEPLINVVDAMGANIVNTVVEGLAQAIAHMFHAELGVRILSNFCDERLAHAECIIRFDQLATDATHDNGFLVARRMRAAHALADADIYRACTHNKGILNGIDAVAIATGNDFRAIEAGAHCFAARGGCYGPLTELMIDEEKRTITARLALPLAVGVVGGLMKVHPGVKLSHAMLGSFAKSSQKLSSAMVSVGLSQCLAALLALSQEGIQKGHMKLHKKKLAYAATKPDPRPTI